MQLVTDVYEITKTFPEQERFGLISQMRRAAVSIPSNVAEGAARKTSKEFIQYLYISQSSLSELDTQVEIAKRLGWLKEADGKSLENTMNRMDKMLSGLIRYQKSPHALRLTPHEKMNIQPTDKGVQ